MDIKYTIKFHSNWHCGSGLSAGADLDALVIKDKNGLPFIPGKTLKGLIKEALEDIKELSGSHIDLGCILGEEANQKKANKEADQGKPVYDTQGKCFFRNAELEETLRLAIIQQNLQEYLYHSVASTAMENGVAKEHSLRKMQVTLPCVLEGEIIDVPDSDEYYFLFKAAFQYIKRIGLNRNRGLGRCSISIVSPIIKEKEE